MKMYRHAHPYRLGGIISTTISDDVKYVSYSHRRNNNSDQESTETEINDHWLDKGGRGRDLRVIQGSHWWWGSSERAGEVVTRARWHEGITGVLDLQDGRCYLRDIRAGSTWQRRVGIKLKGHGKMGLCKLRMKVTPWSLSR